MNEKTDQQLLQEKYIYFSDSGILIDRKTNKPVGQFYKTGYLTLIFKKKPYAIHRIIYCMYYGYFPEHHIDHINGCKLDNRISNLREVTPSCNAKNTKVNYKSFSGVKGVTWSNNDKCWKVIIGHNNEKIFVGRFKNLINAVKARRFVEKIFNYNTCEYISSAEAFLKNYSSFDLINKQKEINSEWDFFCYSKKEKLINKAKFLGTLKD